MSVAVCIGVNALVGAASIYEAYLLGAPWIGAAAVVSTMTMFALALSDNYTLVTNVAAVVYVAGAVGYVARRLYTRQRRTHDA